MRYVVGKINSESSFPLVCRRPCIDAFIYLLLFGWKTFNRGKVVVYTEYNFSVRNKNDIFRAPVWRIVCMNASGTIYHPKTRRIWCS